MRDELSARPVAVLAFVLLLATGCGSVSAQGIGRESAAGGGAAGGGSAGSGGDTVAPSCTTPLAERVETTELALAAPVIGTTEYYPVVLAPTPDAGSLIGWREAGQNAIHVTRLTGSDSVAAELPPTPGMEVHAILAHEEGGAMLLVDDDPDIYSPKYCISVETPDNYGVCGKMDLLRFDDAGSELWRSTLTRKNNVDSDGALFVWRYEHTARLGFEDGAYAAYFRVAGSTPKPGVPGEVDIFPGDALFFTGESGTPIEGGWDWGCSQSWAVRLAYNGRWGAACHGEPNPAGLRLAILAPGVEPIQALLHEGVPPRQRALGGMVPMDGSFWLSHISLGESGVLEVHLARIRNDGQVESDTLIGEATGLDAAYPFRAQLAAYAEDKLLLGWSSGGQLQLMILDRESGAPIEGPIATGAPIGTFDELVTLSNGDVAWAYSAGAGTLSFTRIRSCPADITTR